MTEAAAAQHIRAPMNNRGQRQKIRHHNAPILVQFSTSLMRLLMAVSDTLAVKYAHWLWFRSPRFKQPARETRWSESARLVYLQHQYGPIALYIWGTSGPIVTLVHGWSGRGTQLAAFAEPLVDAGFRVIAFDAPGHGLSRGKSTTIFRYQEVLAEIAKQYGPLHGIIAHSYGALVCSLALKQNLMVNKLVFISAPITVRYLLDMYCETYQMSERVENALLMKLQQEFGANIWHDTSALENLSTAKQPILIIHDKNDKDVPYNNAEALHQAAPNSELLLTDRLGHRRILRAPQILKKVTEFMQNGSEVRSGMSPKE